MNLFRIARQALALVLLVAVTERGLAQTDTADRYTQTRTIGDGVTVTWIRDNAADHTMARSLFVDTPDSVMARLGLTDGVPATISTFLVETGGRIILFDTGYGFPDSRLADALRRLGHDPSEIDLVYLTHFHRDHIGGLMHGDTAAFPHAEVYASRPEYDAWMAMPPDRNAQQVKTMNAYRDRLHLFAFGDTLPGGVLTIDAVGHTPGHTAYRVGRLLIIGDLIHGAARTRRRILDYARREGLVMAGMHLPPPALLPSR